MRMISLMMAALASIGAAAPRAAAQADNRQRLERLVERVAAGDAADADLASQELLELLSRPIAEAFEAAQKRPLEQQIRVYNALRRLYARINIRIYQSTLSGAQREAFDHAAQESPRLLELLFCDDPEQRIAALKLLPRDASGGALIAAKLFDNDALVVEAALNAAREAPSEPVVAGLERYLEEACAALESNSIEPGQEYVGLVILTYASRCVEILAEVGRTEAAPLVLRTLDLLRRSPHARYVDAAVFADALGGFGDERAVDALMALLDDHGARRTFPLPNGAGSVTQTVGDAALHALCRIYKLEPAEFGMRLAGEPPIAGFISAEARSAGRRAFRIWHERNAKAPAGQRQAPSTQPSSAPADQP